MTYKVKRYGATDDWAKKHGPGRTYSYVKPKKPSKINKVRKPRTYGRIFETNDDYKKFDREYKRKYKKMEARHKKTRQRAAIRRAQKAQYYKLERSSTEPRSGGGM
jgi:hypothetical protein